MSDQKHLLILSTEFQSFLLIHRSLDREFMKYITAEYGFAFPDALPSSLSQQKNAKTVKNSTDDSFGSNVLKLSEIALSIRYRYVESNMHLPQQSLALSPLELRVGLLSLSSKSSVIDGGVLLNLAGGTDLAPTKSEKFSIVVENIKCVVSNEIVLYLLQESMRNMETLEDILMKMRMVQTCYRYQNAILFYKLLGKVVLLLLSHVVAPASRDKRTDVQDLCGCISIF
mgnify:CR=1 FL=1